MPHIQLDHSLSLSDDDRRRLTGFLTDRYAEEMSTTTGHVAVSLRALDRSALALGRALEDAPIVIVNADVRRGRPFERRRSFALVVIDHLARTWSVPPENVKVVFTEHAGVDMMGHERVGGEWSGEDAG